MVITLDQQYDVGEKPTVTLYTYINGHAGTPNKTKTKYTMSLDYSSSVTAVYAPDIIRIIYMYVLIYSP